MITPDETTISADAVARAARLIAEAFELGNDAQPSNDWPVDAGDSVLAAQVSGGFTGSVLLAVNQEVITRITADPERLNSVFQAALDTIATAQGTQLRVGEFGLSDLTPPVSAEIRDGDTLCALFGVALQPAAGTVGTPSVAADYEPSPLTPDHLGLGGASTGSLNVLHDVEMEVTVELGRTTMPIRELLALQPGTVVEIDRAAGSPIDVLVNGHHIASGEVVVIDQEFGIRITEIVTDGHSV